LAVAWALGIGVLSIARRRRLAALSALVSLVAALLGGFATVFIWLLI